MNSIKNFLRLSSMLIAYIFLCGCPPSTSSDDGADLYTATEVGSCSLEETIPNQFSNYSGVLASSADHSIITISASNYNYNQGLVRITNINCDETQTLLGSNQDDYFGRSISMNESGNRLAIGIPGDSNNQGLVKIYEYDGSSSYLEIASIPGENSGDQFGYSVSFNAPGDQIAISAPYYANKGKVYLYQNPTWTKIAEFEGDTTDSHFGFTIALSADAQTIAIGVPSKSPSMAPPPTTSFVRILTYNGSSWDSSNIIGTASVGFDNTDYFGTHIALRKNGKALLVGGSVVHLGLTDKANYYELQNNTWNHIITLEGNSNGGGFGLGLAFAHETEPYTNTPIFAIAATVNSYVNIYQKNAQNEIELINTTAAKQYSTFGQSILIDKSGTQLSIGQPVVDTVFHYELAESLNPDFFRLLQEALLTYQPSGSTNPIQPGGASGGDGGNTITTQTKGLHQLILDIILDNEAVADQLSELTIELISDDPTNSFTVLVDPYQNATFSVNKFIGKATSSSDGSQLLFTQQTGTEVTGTLTEADGTVTTNVKLSGAIIQGADFDPSQTTVSDDNKTISMNITSGNIIQGTFVVPSPTVTLTLVSDTVEDTFTLDDTIFTQFPSGTTFAFSGIAGTLAGGTLNGAQTLLTGSTVTQTGSVSGTLTIPSGDYAGTYSDVSLTGATITSASVVGTTASNTFSGTDVKNNGDTAKITAGAFDIVFLNIPDTITPAYAISGGELDGQTFTTTSGTMIARVTSGSLSSLPATIDYTLIDGSIGAVYGTVPSPNSGQVTGFTGNFTNVPLYDYSSFVVPTFEDVMVTSGSFDSSGNIFTASTISSGTIVDPGGEFDAVFPIYILVDASGVTTTFSINLTSPTTYNGETFTCNNSPVGNNNLFGTLSGGTFNASGTTYSGASAELDVDNTCVEVTLSTSGAKSLRKSPDFLITSTLSITGSFDGLTFTGTSITSGTLTKALVTPGGSCTFTP